MVHPLTRVLNPLISRLAGGRHFGMAAQIRHVGRAQRPRLCDSVGARVGGGMAVIPLTFGNQSDWSKNVRAAGVCSIRVNGKDYQATEPEFITPEEARPLLRSLYGPAVRASFKLLGIKQYLRPRAVPVGSTGRNRAAWPRRVIGLHRF